MEDGGGTDEAVERIPDTPWQGFMTVATNKWFANSEKWLKFLADCKQDSRANWEHRAGVEFEALEGGQKKPEDWQVRHAQ